MPPLLTSSTARDIAAGRPSELDAITGAAVRAGRRLGVSTPALDGAARRSGRGMPSAVALIPARSGSERVRDKNIRPLAGHPLLAYAIASGAAGRRLRPRRLLDRQREDRGDRAALRRRRCPSCGRPSSRRRRRPTSSGSRTRSTQLDEHYDLFAIVRATNPFRGARCAAPRARAAARDARRPTRSAPSSSSSSIPGRCGCSEGKTMRPLLDQSHLDVAWHAGQYQALPEIYVQNSALEIAWTRVVSQTGHARGTCRRAVLHRGPRGLQHRRRGGLGPGAAAARRR